MEDRKSPNRMSGTRRNYLRPGIENRERGYSMSMPAAPCNECTYSSSQPAGCDPESLCPNLPLAAAYVPAQPFTCLVSPDEALERGSSFENLYIPYKKGGCM